MYKDVLSVQINSFEFEVIDIMNMIEVLCHVSFIMDNKAYLILTNPSRYRREYRVGGDTIGILVDWHTRLRTHLYHLSCSSRPRSIGAHLYKMG